MALSFSEVSIGLNQIWDTRQDLHLKKSATERKNLIGLTRLIVKDLISSSLSVNRIIDEHDNAVHLKNYFVLIERALKHGLKENYFSGRSSSLWNVLEFLPRYSSESTLIAESVRSLAHTKTPDGKIRAWMRIAMMQKKMPDYFNDLLANKDVLLKNIYHEQAFMLNDEAHVFAGLLIGVNVIDCNFFVKDANFDQMEEIIELSPYLRAVSSFDSDDEQIPKSDVKQDLELILDQKNYLEEWNRKLESTVLDLQRKIKSLEDKNTHLEMEIKLNEARSSALEAKTSQLSIGEKSNQVESRVGSSITGAIRNLIRSSEVLYEEEPKPSKKPDNELFETTEIIEKLNVDISSKNETDKCGLNQTSPSKASVNQLDGEKETQSTSNKDSVLILKLESELARLKERTTILETSYRSSLEKVKLLEADLDIQTSINSEKETTLNIYERDIRDNQNQIAVLRESLTDAKKLNSTLNERVNEVGGKLKEKINMVASLQASLDKWKLENTNLASKLQAKHNKLKETIEQLSESNKNVLELKDRIQKLTIELGNERANSQYSTVTVENQDQIITDLHTHIKNLKAEITILEPFKVEVSELRVKCSDYEQSLEEIGARLRETRLEMDTLKENSALYIDSQWINDKEAKECSFCRQPFSVTRRKHHCRLCGNVFCQACSDNKMDLASSSKPVRVCDTCHSFLLAKFVKSSSHS